MIDSPPGIRRVVCQDCSVRMTDGGGGMWYCPECGRIASVSVEWTDGTMNEDYLEEVNASG